MDAIKKWWSSTVLPRGPLGCILALAPRQNFTYPVILKIRLKYD